MHSLQVELPKKSSTEHGGREGPDAKCEREIAPAPARKTIESATALSVVRNGHLLPGEDANAFEQLQVAAFAALEPRDAIDEILAADFVRYSWDGLRGSRLRAEYLKARVFDELHNLAGGFSDYHDARRFWLKRQTVPNPVKKMLHGLGMTESDLYATACAKHADDLERIGREDIAKFGRKLMLLREFDRRRAFAAAQPAAPEIEDAEFEEVVDERRQAIAAPAIADDGAGELNAAGGGSEVTAADEGRDPESAS